MYQNPFNLVDTSRIPNQLELAGTEGFFTDFGLIEPALLVAVEHRCGGQALALLIAQSPLGHFGQPDIGI